MLGAMANEDASTPLSTESLLELDVLYREAEDEQASIRRLEQKIEKLITEAAFTEFPALRNMSAEDFRKFDDRRNRAASKFALEVANFAYRNENN